MIREDARRVVAIIQARIGSSRLPGKVVRKLGDRTVLEWCIRAAKESDEIDEVVVATSIEVADDKVAEIAQAANALVFRGSEDDVLDRFVRAGEWSRADAIVRLTSDCPLLDPLLISQVVRIWRSDPTLDYVATTLARSFPRGLDVELASMSALCDVHRVAVGYHRTHVTSALYEDGAQFKRLGLFTQPSWSHLRVTLDTPEDAAAIEEIVGLLSHVPPRWYEVVALLEENPDIFNLNSAVRQKELHER